MPCLISIDPIVTKRGDTTIIETRRGDIYLAAQRTLIHLTNLFNHPTDPLVREQARTFLTSMGIDLREDS